jgi:hypothetical protein
MSSIKVKITALVVFLVVVIGIVPVLQVNNYRRLVKYRNWISGETAKVPGGTTATLTAQVKFYNIGRIHCGDYFKGTLTSSLNNIELQNYFESHGYRRVDLNGQTSYASDYNEKNYILALVFDTDEKSNVTSFRFTTC